MGRAAVAAGGGGAAGGAAAAGGAVAAGVVVAKEAAAAGPQTRQLRRCAGDRTGRGARVRRALVRPAAGRRDSTLVEPLGGSDRPWPRRHGEPELTPIKFSRLTKRGVLLGLSGPQLVMASLASGTLIIGLYVGAVVMTFPIILVFVALAFVGVGGRKLDRVGDRSERGGSGDPPAGSCCYRRRVVKPRPAGTLALPGDAARLRQWVDPETDAVMVHDPHAATLTAIVGVSHPAFVLLDPAEQERRVVSWGRVLATACRSGRIASVQVMERTLPDSGKGWRTGGSSTATAPAPGRRRRTASSSTAPARPASATRPRSRSRST